MATRKNKPARIKNLPRELRYGIHVPSQGLGIVAELIDIEAGKRTMTTDDQILLLETVEKLPTLWRHYGKEPSDVSQSTLVQLLLAVLWDWHPGFARTIHPPLGGRPQKWGKRRLAILAERVDAQMAKNKALTILHACDLLREQIVEYKTISAKTLNRQYHKAVKPRRRIR
jgi:hypothetical protein